MHLMSASSNSSLLGVSQN